ncbi:MAG: hypothetical protein AB2A00_40475 [Myxococcota bacterium]
MRTIPCRGASRWGSFSGGIMVGQAGRLDLRDDAASLLQTIPVRHGDVVTAATGEGREAGDAVIWRREQHELVLADIPDGAAATVDVSGLHVVDTVDSVTGMSVAVLAEPSRIWLTVVSTGVKEAVFLRQGMGVVVQQDQVVHPGDVLAMGIEPRQQRRGGGGVQAASRLLQSREPPPWSRASISPVHGVVKRAERRRNGTLLVITPDDGGPDVFRSVRGHASVGPGDSVTPGLALNGEDRSHLELAKVWSRDQMAEHLLDELRDVFADVEARLPARAREIMVHALVGQAGVHGMHELASRKALLRRMVLRDGVAVLLEAATVPDEKARE